MPIGMKNGWNRVCVIKNFFSLLGYKKKTSDYNYVYSLKLYVITSSVIKNRVLKLNFILYIQNLDLKYGQLWIVLKFQYKKFRRINCQRHKCPFVYYFYRRSKVYYYSYTSVHLNVPSIYVFLKMCKFKVIHFIFEASKTVERKNKMIYYDANLNLILIQYLIYSKLRRKYLLSD